MLAGCNAVFLLSALRLAGREAHRTPPADGAAQIGLAVMLWLIAQAVVVAMLARGPRGAHR